MRNRRIVLAAGCLGALILAPGFEAAKRSVFSKDNLVAWCIVPFDALNRGPEERAQMLKQLGISRLAYDWREKDIPTFDQELDALRRHGIRLQAFWLSSGPEPANDKGVAAVLGFLKRRGVKTEIWYSFSAPRAFAALPEEKKLDVAAGAAGYIAAEAGRIGCSVGLYNHGGWFGEPENQIAIIGRLKRKNVGIVYNFHHGREQMDRFPALFAAMLPHLMAVNLNGMKRDAPMILPIGSGDRELEMLRVIQRSSYRGPVGILGHRTDEDAKVALESNLEGLKKLVRELGDEAALKTY
jgi:hypothetical protein